jgi:hypothetical protein
VVVTWWVMQPQQRAGRWSTEHGGLGARVKAVVDGPGGHRGVAVEEVLAGQLPAALRHQPHLPQERQLRACGVLQASKVAGEPCGKRTCRRARCMQPNTGSLNHAWWWRVTRCFRCPLFLGAAFQRGVQAKAAGGLTPGWFCKGLL